MTGLPKIGGSALGPWTEGPGAELPWFLEPCNLFVTPADLQVAAQVLVRIDLRGNVVKRIVLLSVVLGGAVLAGAGCSSGGGDGGGTTAVMIDAASGTQRSADGTWIACRPDNVRLEVTFSGGKFTFNYFSGTPTTTYPCAGGTFQPAQSYGNITVSPTTNQTMSGGWVTILNTGIDATASAPGKASGSGSLATNPVASRIGSSSDSVFMDDSGSTYLLYVSYAGPACGPDFSGNDVCLLNIPFIKGSPTATPPSPTITGFSPSTGKPGTTVTITGTNFSSTAAENSVSLAGMPATVTAASTTSLSVTVPDGFSSGKVAVTSPGGTATSATDFSLTHVSPTISSFSPTSGTPGTQLTITGTDFSTIPNNNTVKVNGVNAPIISSTLTSLVVYVPATSSGTVSVTTAGGMATSSASFTVTATTTFAYTNGDGIPELTSIPSLPSSWSYGGNGASFAVTVPVDSDTASVFVDWYSNTNVNEETSGSVELTPGAAQNAFVTITPVNGASTASGSDYSIAVVLCSVSGQCSSISAVQSAAGAVSEYMEVAVPGEFARGSSPSGISSVTGFTETGVLLPTMTVP